MLDWLIETWWHLPVILAGVGIAVTAYCLCAMSARQQAEHDAECSRWCARQRNEDLIREMKTWRE